MLSKIGQLQKKQAEINEVKKRSEESDVLYMLSQFCNASQISRLALSLFSDNSLCFIDLAKAYNKLSHWIYIHFFCQRVYIWCIRSFIFFCSSFIHVIILENHIFFINYPHHHYSQLYMFIIIIQTRRFLQTMVRHTKLIQWNLFVVSSSYFVYVVLFCPKLASFIIIKKSFMLVSVTGCCTF